MSHVKSSFGGSNGTRLRRDPADDLKFAIEGFGAERPFECFLNSGRELTHLSLIHVV